MYFFPDFLLFLFRWDGFAMELSVVPEDIARLKRGVTVQKHGREGEVKERLIRLTAAETAFFWQVEH